MASPIPTKCPHIERAGRAGCRPDAVPAAGIVKHASVAEAKPGQTVTYTVTVTNTGKVDYTTAAPASFTDDPSKVLDDATYNNDATSGATYAAPVISWSGALPVGATVSVTYSVKVNTPDTGDHKLNNTVVGGPETNCAPGSTDPQCSVAVPGPLLHVVKTASTNSVMPGGKVTYTVTLTNTGQADFTTAKPASFTDNLSKVLDDASYNNDASNGATYTAPTVSWSGALAAGASTTVTYSVSVNNPDSGDRLLDNAVSTPPAVPSNCTTGSTDPACATRTRVASYTVAKTTSASRVQPGATITYTIVVTNTGQAAYITTGPATFTDDLSQVLDDATYNNDATKPATYTAPVLSWSAALPVGGSVTITYSVTVKGHGSGDGKLHNAVLTPGASTGGNCPSGATDPKCFVDTTIGPLASSGAPALPVTGTNTQLLIILAGLLLTGGTMMLLLAGVRRGRITS
jgi:uncharacterized repeat protein (TIGR01451 family)